MGVNKLRVLIVAGVVLLLAAAGGIFFAIKNRRGELANTYVVAVEKHLKAGAYDNARIEAEKLVRVAGGDANSHFLKAKALLAGRNPASIRTAEPNGLAAIQALFQTVKIDPTLIEAQRLLVAYFVGQRNWNDAGPFARQILEKIPDDPIANYVTARSLIDKKETLSARTHVESLLAAEKPLPRPRTAVLAAALGDAAKGDEAKKMVESADEALSAYDSKKSRFEDVEDRIALVELRKWKSQRASEGPVVEFQIGAAIDELGKLVADEKSNDGLPGRVLQFAEQILPLPGTYDARLEPVYKRLAARLDKLTNEINDIAVERKVLDYRIYLAFAERLRAAGKIEEAVAKAKQGLINAKDATAAVKTEFGACDVWLAKHFLSLKNHDAAKPHIEALLADKGWKPWGQLLDGYRLVQKEDYEAASAQLEPAVKAEILAQNGTAHALYGLAMLRRGFVTIGLQHLEKGKQLGADGPQTRAWLALALAEAGITDKAIEMAEQVVGSERTNGIGKALIGELKLRAGRIDEAEKDLAAAADSVDPKLRPMVRLARAQALLAKNDVAGAQPLLDEVKKSGDFAYRAYAIEARYHQQAGVRAKADAILAEGRAKFPDNGLLLALEIRDLEERKQFSKALGILKTEQQRNPKALLPRLLLSDVYDSDNSRPLGIATLEEALRQFPNEASLKWRLADKMLTAGRLKDAGVYIAELAGEKSINKSAIDYLAARHASLDGKPEKATQIIREALEKDKDNPSLKLLIGQIEARNHNFTEAARNLKQVSEAQNGRYGPTKALFETLLCDGKTVEAAEVLRKAESNGLAEPIRPLRRHLLRLLAQRELHAELKREIADLLSRNPVDVDVALVINLLQGMGEGAKADALLTESLKKAPDSAILQEVRIAIMIDKKRYREAQGELSELFRQEKFKKNPTLHTLRIRADIAQNDLAGASKLCDAALARENCPGNPALIALKVQLLLRLKQQTEAESFAENSKRDFPRLPAAKYLLARAYEAVGNSEQAFKLLSELLETDPGDANASHHYLRMLIARGQFGNLEPSIENFIAANKGKEKQGENPLLLGVLAEFHATRNDLPKAETVLRRLEQQPNAGVIVAYLRGVVAFQKGETAVAEKALQVAMADPMGHTPSTFMFAQIRAQQGKLDESLRLLNQIARNPEAPAAVPLVRAQLLHRMKKTQEAETACREYLSAHPSARPFRQLLTSILLDRKDPAAREEALQLARQALGEGVENPFDFEVYLTVLFQADKANEALQILAQQAIARNKNDLALAGGRACFNAGLYREAERYAKKIVHDEPNHQNARLLYGDALSRMAAAPETGAAERDATFNRAAEQYRDVLRLSKNNVVAANNLAWTLGVQLGRPHRALEELRDAFPQALNLNNKELPAEFLDTVGVLHLKMDRLSDAQRFLEEAVARKATAVESLIHLGEVYKKQDRPDRARQVLEQARKFDSKGEHAKRIETMMAN